MRYLTPPSPAPHRLPAVDAFLTTHYPPVLVKTPAFRMKNDDLN